MGRPLIKITPNILQRVEELPGQGLTQEQIAHCLGIGRSTLMKKKKFNGDLVDAIKRGQSKGIEQVSISEGELLRELTYKILHC